MHTRKKFCTHKPLYMQANFYKYLLKLSIIDTILINYSYECIAPMRLFFKYFISRTTMIKILFLLF